MEPRQGRDEDGTPRTVVHIWCPHRLGSEYRLASPTLCAGTGSRSPFLSCSCRQLRLRSPCRTLRRGLWWGTSRSRNCPSSSSTLAIHRWSCVRTTCVPDASLLSSTTAIGRHL